MMKRGLMLMVGATGSGKSTTLAAMINYRNENSSDHIITIEDPIEFLHTNKKSIVNQREVGLDTKSYARALRSAMRAAPDVHPHRRNPRPRDAWSRRSCWPAPATWCWRRCTPTTRPRRSTASSTCSRATSTRRSSSTCRSTCARSSSQRLVPGKNKRRCAAVEVMINTPHVQELIKKGDVIGAKEALRTSSEKGMQHFDTALYELYRPGASRWKTRWPTRTRARNLEAKINFG